MTNDHTHRSSRAARFPGPLRLPLASLAWLAALCLFAFVTASPASAASTGISGTVTDAISSAPAGSVQVNVYDATSGGLVSATCTAPDGTYIFGGLPAGTYKVGFESTEGDFKVCGGKTNYLPQFYSAQPTLAAAAVVTVTGGATTPNVNATMYPGGAIGGTVTDATTGHAAPGVEVDAFDSAGALASSTCTGSDGTYALFALAKGSYRVEFLNTATCGSSTRYRTQFYKDQASLSAAQPVAVSTSATTAGVDAALVPTNAVTLSVATAGSGSGAVRVASSGATCTSSCSYPFAPGSSVTLTAAAASGSSFAGWSGPCSGTGTCTVKLTSDQKLSATFTKGSSPPWGKQPPKCRLSVSSTRVLLKAPRGRSAAPHRKRAIGRVGQVKLGYACDQSARLWLHGSVTLTVAGTRRSGRGKSGRPHARTVATPMVTLKVRAGTGGAGVRLPSVVLRALAGHAKVLARFSLTCANATGSGSARTRTVRLRTGR